MAIASETAEKLTPIPGEVILDIWHKPDQKVTSDVSDYWNEPGVLSETSVPEERLKQLLAVAYVDDQLAGITTAVIVEYEALKCKFAFLRIAILPDFRLHYLQQRIALSSKEFMSAYSKEHPSLHLFGMMTVRQASYQATRMTPPRTPTTGSTLIDYTEKGQQRRINWFDHARV